MKVIAFLRSDAPAVRARREFWTKLIVVYLYAAAVIAFAAVFENWLSAHKFVGALLAITAVACFFVIGVVWRFNVPCPRCGWNINLKKNPPGWPAITVPSFCPNCGEGLYQSLTKVR